MKVIVSRQELLAALLFASEDSDRYTLCGVLVEVAPKKLPMLVATDGRRLAAIETSVVEQAQEFKTAQSFILRADYIDIFAKLSKACGGKLFPWVCIEWKGDKRVVVSLIGGKSVLDVEEGALIEGHYPDWRKAMPAKDDARQPISEIGLNAEFIGDFAKAAKILGAESPVVQMNLVGPDSCVEVHINGMNNFYGIVMQTKLNEGVDYQPEFLKIVEGLTPEPKPTIIDVSRNSDPLAEAVVNGMKNVDLGPNVTVSVNGKAVPLPDLDENEIEACVEVIRAERKATVSLLQRRRRLGYNMAMRIMDELENRGMVGPADGAEPRKILFELNPVDAAA